MTQQLVNNGYSNKDIQRTTRRALDRWFSQTDEADSEVSKINLYYRNFWHPNYKRDETALKEIIDNNISVTDPVSKLNLIIYYRNRKTAQMIMKNSPRTEATL